MGVNKFNDYFFKLFFRNFLLERKLSEDFFCLKREGRVLIFFVILMCKLIVFVWGWSFKIVRFLMEIFYSKDILKDVWI